MKVLLINGSPHAKGSTYTALHEMEKVFTENGIEGSDGEMSVTLTEDEVFLLCDNREEYIDSRNEKLGPVNMRDIKGNVLFCVWPFSRFGGID